MTVSRAATGWGPAATGGGLRLIAEADRAGVDWIDVRREVMDDYNAGLQQELEQVAVWHSGASDYYRTASGRIVTQWPHGFAAYQERVDKVDLSAFETGKADRAAR